ncbi:efflux RND transporter periplasmic adaptor subunit [Psychromonas aquimarina]|uniref:efflux RND transporter periplasmic adaptor subunit n=1 Tax=Psychromonas aquimarina TaxID=444919 RepID=UPI0003F56C52|nr:efflux RND transporter periplasmic adaptor subunit [Psychromonas aquimarina]
MKKRWIAAAVITAVTLGTVYYFNTPHKEVLSLPLITAETGSIEKQAVAVGQIVPAHSVQIKSQIEGIVGEIYHGVGEQVKAGTALIKIRPNPTPQRLTQAITELMSSQAQLQSSKQKLSNLERLVRDDVIPSNYGEYIQAKANVSQNNADLQQKQQNLDLIRSGESSVGSSKLTSTITAPITGTVLSLNVEVGEPIISTESSQSATQMMSLADMSDMIFKGSVSEHDAAQLQAGMPVTMTLAPYPEVEMTGTLSKVAVQSEKLNLQQNSSSSSEQRSFDNGFQVEVNNILFPADLIIRSGFSATAQITLKKADQVTTIPERALQFSDNKPEILLPDDSAQGFHAVPVELGLSDGINVEVISGLQQGQEIVDSSMMGALPDA